MRAPLLACLGLAGSLLAPASASAAFQTFGSDLSASATVAESHQADTAFWPTTMAGGRDPQVPVAGQISDVRIKGLAVRREDQRAPGSPGGETMFHVQAMTPQSGGRHLFRITSQAFYLPTAGDPQQVSSYRPENFCVQPGESIAFNTVGGWDGTGNTTPSPISPYPQGTPLQIFARVPGATTKWYEQANGTDNGEFTTTTGGPPRAADQGNASVGQLDGQELLMQMTVATGDDRSYECGGPNTYRPADADKPGGATPKPVFQKARIPEQRLRFSSKYKSTLALLCAAGPGRCRGKLTITAGRPAVTVASARFSIAAKSAGRVNLRLTKAGRKLWTRSKRRLPARLTAVTAAGGPNFTDSQRAVLGKRGR